MANNLIQVKRTSVSGRAANTTTLTNPGELALNMADGIMYSTNGSVVFEVGANLTSQSITTNNLSVGTSFNVVSNGNVGIGTTNPTQKLHVNGGIFLETTNQISFFGTGYFIRASTGLEIQSADFIRCLTGGTNERLRIDSSGNVGIGNTTPTHTLRVEGDLSIKDGLHANGSLGTAGQVLTSNGSVAYWADAAGGAGGGYYYGDNGAVGDAGNKVNIFRVNATTLNANVTFANGENGSATGPVTVVSGVTLTIQSGARVAIV